MGTRVFDEQLFRPQYPAHCEGPRGHRSYAKPFAGHFLVSANGRSVRRGLTSDLV